MEELLYNPIYHAMLTGDAHLCYGEGAVKCFDEQVSPFVGFPAGYTTGFEELYNMLRPGRKIVYATPEDIATPKGWSLIVAMKGLQFVYSGDAVPGKPSVQLAPLDKTHVEEMVQLAMLTKPGPFGLRTIEFGHYHGVFENGKLVAMTGQRLHPGNYTEISAVCTHPDHSGKGYAAALMRHQMQLIQEQGQRAFLHVRADNERAIGLYERLGFTVSRGMNFYFMRRD